MKNGRVWFVMLATVAVLVLRTAIAGAECDPGTIKTTPQSGATLAPATVGTPYQLTISATGASGDYTWSTLNANNPPPGITFTGGHATSSMFTGTPTTEGGPYRLAVLATDFTDQACFEPVSFDLFVVAPVDAGADASTPDASIDASIDASTTDASTSDASTNASADASIPVDASSDDDASTTPPPPPVCSPDGQACGAGCCADLACVAGRCAPTRSSPPAPTCKALRASCKNTTECCRTPGGRELVCDTTSTVQYCCVASGASASEDDCCPGYVRLPSTRFATGYTCEPEDPLRDDAGGCTPPSCASNGAESTWSSFIMSLVGAIAVLGVIRRRRR